MLGEHMRLTGDAAYVLALLQKAVDDHFFTFGVGPASGSGNGFQLEAIAAYQFTNGVSLDIGGRWWHLNTNAIDSFQQLGPIRSIATESSCKEPTDLTSLTPYVSGACPLRTNPSHST